MRYSCLVFLLFLSFFCMSQKPYYLIFTNNNYKDIKKNHQLTFKDSLQRNSYLTSFRNLALEKGYLLASFDTLNYRNDTLLASFYIGKKFGKSYLKIDEKDLFLLQSISSINERLIRGIPFSPFKIAQLLSSIQKALENNGYPFSKVQLTEVKIENETLTAKIIIDKKPQYTWKDIHLKGDSSIAKAFICNLIGIKEADLFNQQKVRQISKKIKQISFLKEIKKSEILFTKEGVELFLYISSNPISSINGVIGIQPDNVNDKMNFTGDISLKLVNVIKKGEQLELNWKSIQDQTQSLQTKLNYPFLFNSNFGVDGQFNLFKKDSSFLELKSSLGLLYFLDGGNYLKLFYQNISSNILSQNSSTSLMKDVKTNSYGLSIFRRQFDYIPNPRSGFTISSSFSIGSRRESDSTLSSISTTLRGDFNLEWAYTIYGRNVLYLSNKTDIYQAPAIYQNELDRFGGQTSQRGFNEQELFATAKTTINIEYRFLLDQNSRLFVFYDQTWYENNSGNYYNDNPFGFGAGFSFGTNIGIFSLSYALGKQFENPVLMRDGKIHFGYVSYF